MPFWKDLVAARQILSDAASLAVNKIGSDQDIAHIHNDAQVWSVNHLAKAVSGDDPMQAILDLVGDYWARTDQSLVISCLKGIFAAASMANNKLGIASETIAGQSASTRLEWRDVRGRDGEAGVTAATGSRRWRFIPRRKRRCASWT